MTHIFSPNDHNNAKRLLHDIYYGIREGHYQTVQNGKKGKRKKDRIICFSFLLFSFDIHNYYTYPRTSVPAFFLNHENAPSTTPRQVVPELRDDDHVELRDEDHIHSVKESKLFQ